jgi:glycosyltransferase involved in cell wall biosynthesis
VRAAPPRPAGERPKVLHVTTVDLSLHVLLGYQLRRFAEAGYEVVGASAPGPYVDRVTGDGRVRHVAVPSLTRGWTPGRDAVALRDLARVIRRERPAIVHTHNPKSGVLGRVAARLSRVPVVVNTVHGLYANPALPPARRRAIAAAERWAMRFSDLELFQSWEDLDLAVRTRMVRASRASYLGNGVDLARFDPGRVDPSAVAALRRTWGVRDGQVVVGTVGRLVREKGYEELFAAAALVGADRHDTAFVAVGPVEPAKADRLAGDALARARRDGVVLHGEGDDMPAIYGAFDVFVLASHREGMPRSLIEAQAMGLPAVATAIRGCREVVVDEETGRLVPARDPSALAAAIRDLLAHPGRARAMGAAGRVRARDRFDEQRVVERTLAVYERLLGRWRSRGGPA